MFRAILLFLFVLLLGMAAAPLRAAPPASDAELPPLDQQKKIERLEEGISAQRKRLSSTRQQEKGLLEELADIDRQLAAEQQRLSDLKKELERQEKLIQTKKGEADKSLAAKDRARPKVESRLRAYYTMGPLGMMNILFSARSLPDLLTFDEYFQRMLRHDEQLVDEFRSKIGDLARSREELEAQKKELVGVINQVKEQEKSLSASRQERKDLLTRVRGEKRLYEQALKEIENAAASLTATLKKMKKEEASRSDEQQAKTAAALPSKRKPGSGTDFVSQKGWLDPPVTGTVTTTFGKNTSEQFGLTTFANGIDIRTTGGANVKAIHGGDIVFAGFLSGYGNIIIIDHGQQYFSLVARMAKLLKKEGEQVNGGEVVGIMDEEESLLGEGLHFEIRRGTEPENPLQWINNAKLKIQATRRINR